MTGPSLYDQYVASQKPVSSGSLYDQYIAAKSAGAPQTTADKLHAQYKAGTLGGRMARENANDADQADAETPDYGTQVMGGIASLGRDIPGMEAVQSAARAFGKRESYSTARDELRNAEADAPSVVRNYNRIAGSVVAGAALPSQIGGKTLTPAMQAALFGGAGGLAQSDPNASIGDRLKAGGIGAAVGGIVGKAGEGMSNVVRALSTKTLGSQALAQKAAMETADAQNYGAAATEGAASGGTSPAIQKALAEPDIAPYVDVVKQSRTLQGADDATVLREAYKLMSERQGLLNNRIINTSDFKAGTQLENKDIGAAKGALQQAAAPTMPSFDTAVSTHADLAGQQDAMRQGADAAQRAISGAQVAGKKLELNSPEAFLAAIKQMSPEDARAALQGVMGRTRGMLSMSKNPLTGFGTMNGLGSSPVAPFIRTLDQQGGGAPMMSDLVRAYFAAQGHPSP